MALSFGKTAREAPGVDCYAWEAHLMGLGHANAQKAYEVVDQIEISMNRLATKIMADPRRVQAIQSGCPNSLLDIQARGAAAAKARQIPDPAHDPAMLEGWLKSLPSDLLAELEKAVKAEAASRKKASAKKKK